MRLVLNGAPSALDLLASARNAQPHVSGIAGLHTMPPVAPLP